MLNVKHVQITLNNVRSSPNLAHWIGNAGRTGLCDYHIFQICVDDFMRDSNFGMGVLHVKVKY